MKVRIARIIFLFGLLNVISCKPRQFNQNSSPDSNASKVSQAPWQKTTLDVALLKKLYAANDLRGLETYVLQPELEASLGYIEVRLQNPSIDSTSKKNLESLLKTGTQLKSQPATFNPKALLQTGKLFQPNPLTPEKLAVFSMSLACALTEQDNPANPGAQMDATTSELCANEKRRNSFLHNEVYNSAERRRVWLLPTWADWSLSQFTELLSYPIMPLALTFIPSQSIDGQMMPPADVIRHDLVHFDKMDVYGGVREFTNRDLEARPREEIVQIAQERETFFIDLKHNLAEKYTLNRPIFDKILFDFLHEDYYSSRPLGHDPRRKSTILTELQHFLKNTSEDCKKFKAKQTAVLPRSNTILTFNPRLTSFNFIQVIGLFPENERNTDVKMDKVVDDVIQAIESFQSAIPKM